MQRIAASLTVLAFALALLPSALARSIAANASTEPTTVFMKGGNPEWSPPHLEFQHTRGGHDALHSAMRQQHERWHMMTSSRNPDGDQFKADHRAFHEKLNRWHRMMHRLSGTERIPEAMMGSEARGDPAAQMERQGPIIRMSRRLIEQGALERMRTESATLGK